MKRTFDNFSRNTSLVARTRHKKIKKQALFGYSNDEDFFGSMDTSRLFEGYASADGDNTSTDGMVDEERVATTIDEAFQHEVFLNHQILESLCGEYQYIKPRLCSCQEKRIYPPCCSAQSKWRDLFYRRSFSLTIERDSANNYKFKFIELHDCKDCHILSGFNYMIEISGLIEVIQTSENERKIQFHTTHQVDHKSIDQTDNLFKCMESDLEFLTEVHYFPFCKISNVPSSIISFEMLSKRFYFRQVKC